MIERLPTRALVLVLIFTSVCVSAACAPTGGDPAGPKPPTTKVAPEPLRRLSVYEYENTLADLFPGLTVDDAPPLPRDPQLNGFTNDAASLGVSQLHVARLEEAAAAYGRAATSDAYLATTLAPCTSWSTPDEQDACMTDFATSFAHRAFRGPADESFVESLRLRMSQWRERVDFAGAIELAIVTTLMSADFLYRLEPIVESSDDVVPVDGYELATRLSYALWGSMPDAELFAAADDGSLLDTDVLEREARRMLEDARAERMWTRFFVAWLGLDDFLTPENEQRLDYPQWTTDVRADAFDEATRFFAHLYRADPTLHGLLLDRTAFVTGRLAPFYGVALDAGAGVTEVVLPESERAGILTRVALLAMRAHPSYPSPPLRGANIRARLLCGSPLNPPPDADLSQPVPSPTEGPRTNRQLFEARAAAAVCQGCHVELDGIGFGFERYDEAGVYRDLDEGMAVDARGLLLGTDVDGSFDGAIALSERLSESLVTQRCYVSRMVQYVYGVPSDDDATELVDDLAARFYGSSGNGRELLVDIVTHPRFRLRSAVGR